MIIQVRLFILLICLLWNQHLVESTEFACNASTSCGCSQYNALINSRIVGGEPAINRSWGWAVSLRVLTEIHFCGGTILSPMYILTAAHCVDDPDIVNYDLKVAVGTDTLTDNDGQRIAVDEIFLHPHWTSKTNENDIAILKLKTPIVFRNQSIAKICLPSMSTSILTEFPRINSLLVAIGWGYTTMNGNLSNVLRQVTLQAIDHQETKCRNSINNITLQFCAAVSGGGKDTCEGDSGGPIMYYSELYQRWLIVGITSYGHGCAVSFYAGVYTRISMYIDWIKSITEKDAIITIDVNNAKMNMIPNKFFMGATVLFLILLIKY
ncbi:hypothetical protein I4U23_026065 [Adineta vaga]|nr:hypothetical protein I4U23_026065 [Adineta vaga]